jgi:hypothetical protein
MKRLQVVHNFAKPSAGELYELDEAIKARNSKGLKAIHIAGTAGALAALPLAMMGKEKTAFTAITGGLGGKAVASHMIYGKDAKVIKDFKKKYGDKTYKDRKMLVLKDMKKKK